MSPVGKRVALISGGTRGIGKATIDVFREMDVDVVYLHRQPRPEGESADDAGIRAICCDVRDFDRVGVVVKQIEHDYGQVHYLVNNAGVTRDRPLFQMSPDEWSEVIGTNLTGAFNLCRCMILKMIKRNFGRIINVASISGLVGAAGQSNYAASKAGLIAFTKSVAREVAPFKVTCNALAPGYIETDMTGALSEFLKERSRKMIPAGRFGTVAEIKSAIRFLVADDSTYVNGSVIKIDGGMI